MQLKVVISVLVIFSSLSFASEKSLVDKRDGQRYNIVKIGDQIWMAENLRHKTKQSYCYLDNVANCSKYGRMYPWHVAMNLPPSKAYDDDNVAEFIQNEHQGVCPNGWHIPSVDEFDALKEKSYEEVDESAPRKYSSDAWENYLRNPKGFNLRYGGQLMIYSYEYYNGYKEVDPTAAARYFKTGKRGEFPLEYVYNNLNHFIAFATTDAEGPSTRTYSFYADRYNFDVGAGGVYRGASGSYVRCVKNFECPAGEELHDGICEKPVVCDENEYAVDKWKCEILPDNAKRNKKFGFSCNKGYDRIEKDGDVACLKPYSCEDSEYVVSKYECEILPQHAIKNKKGFDCMEGYAKAAKGNSYECVSLYKDSLTNSTAEERRDTLLEMMDSLPKNDNEKLGDSLK